MGQEQDPPFPFFRWSPVPDGRTPLHIPRKPHRQNTKSELKYHPQFVRLPSLPRMHGRPYDDFRPAESFPYPRPYGPHRPGPRGDGRPERLPWNAFRDPDLADGQRAKDRRRSPVVIFVGVGQREDVDPPYPLETQKRKNRARSRVPMEGASPIDQHVAASGKRNDVGRAFSDVQRREGEIPLGERGIWSVDPSEKERGGEDGRGPGAPPAPEEKDRPRHGRRHGESRPRDARRRYGEAPRP